MKRISGKRLNYAMMLGVFLTAATTAQEYVVVEGDSLSKIVAKFYPPSIYGSIYSLDGALKKVVELNPWITNPDIIYSGKVIDLHLPELQKKSEKIVVVKKGDTFSDIALKHYPNPQYRIYGKNGVINKLKSINPHIKDFNNLVLGEKST
jgi:nucleoid-associated protein YgaU